MNGNHWANQGGYLMKKLPIGIENFRLARMECYYIDKTLLLDDILSRPRGTAFLYTRPRRFGKSLINL